MRHLQFTKLSFAFLVTCILFWLVSPEVVFAQTVPNTDTISVKAPSEGFNLDVVILKKKQKETRLPAIIFIVGSGEGSTMQSYRSMKQFFLEETFLEDDFALVYFDKRGLGASEGVWYETSFEDRALDARNVALEIQKLEFIDADRIYVVGHSQGGWIVQIALANYPETFAGGVSMAGPTFGVRKQLVNDYMSGNLCKGMDSSRALKKAQRKVNRDLFFISLLARKGNMKKLKIIKDFEAKPYIKEIKRPILLLFAENDPLVSPEWSLEELDLIFPEGLPPNMTSYVAPGEQHSFKTAPKCYSGKSKDLEYSEMTRQVIYDWVKGL